MSKLSAHINNIALHHSVFALPFAYMGVFLAAKGIPTFHDFLWVTLAMIGARSSALAMDNLVDLKFDKQQNRMSKRPLVTGAIKPIEVIILIIVRLCIFLGVALAMAPAGGYIAVTGELPFGIILLSGGVCLWIGSFDVIYGSQDRQFDLDHKLHSMATQFGVANAHKIAAFFHFISILCFIGAGIYFDLSFIYYIGVLIAILTLIYQHSLITPYDFSRLTQVYFMRNGIVSIVIFVFTLIDILS